MASGRGRRTVIFSKTDALQPFVGPFTCKEGIYKFMEVLGEFEFGISFSNK